MSCQSSSSPGNLLGQLVLQEAVSGVEKKTLPELTVDHSSFVNIVRNKLAMSILMSVPHRDTSFACTAEVWRCMSGARVQVPWQRTDTGRVHTPILRSTRSRGRFRRSGHRRCMHVRTRLRAIDRLRVQVRDFPFKRHGLAKQVKIQLEVEVGRDLFGKIMHQLRARTKDAVEISLACCKPRPVCNPIAAVRSGKCFVITESLDDQTMTFICVAITRCT